MTALPRPKPRKNRYRVTYQDGKTTISTGVTSLDAEKKAIRSRPGIIMKTKFLKGTSK